MKKLLPALLLAGCGPLSIDFTATLGANQSIKKTLEIDQKQSKAQVEAQSNILEDLADAIWKAQLARATPTPTPSKLKSVTISVAEFEPTPEPIIVYQAPSRVQRVKPSLPKAKKPVVTPTPCPSPEKIYVDRYEGIPYASETPTPK